MSPYFVKQKQQSLALSSQQQRQAKKKTQQIMDQIDLSAGGVGLSNAGIMVQNNVYSRNRGGIHDAKTSYS